MVSESFPARTLEANCDKINTNEIMMMWIPINFYLQKKHCKVFTYLRCFTECQVYKIMSMQENSTQFNPILENQFTYIRNISIRLEGNSLLAVGLFCCSFDDTIFVVFC